MACYISSNDNRFYAAMEPAYGTVAAITATERFSGVRLAARQELEMPRRRDKTGSRTWQGFGGALRRKTSFSLDTYLVGRSQGAEIPGMGPLIQAALGSAPRISGPLMVQSSSGTAISFAGVHGLNEGMAVSFNGEIRFTAAMPSPSSVVLNAPFSTDPAGGSMLGAAVAYSPATSLGSVSLYDYWSPEGSVQRLLRGAAVDRMEISLNGDFHEFRFEGIAADLLDSASFVPGQGGLLQFPAEPSIQSLIQQPIPGHLGQAWAGTGPARFHTVTRARILIKNNLETRRREFGMLEPRCLVAGEREVEFEFELYSRDDASFNELYQAARQRSPVSCFLQMGETEGELCGIYLKSFVPEIPEFIDDEPRLRWRFRASRAQGTAEDEIYVAFA